MVASVAFPLASRLRWLRLLHSAFCLLPCSKTRAFLARFLVRAQKPARRRSPEDAAPFPLAGAPARKVTTAKNRPVQDRCWLPCQACSLPSRTPRIRPPESEAPRVSVSGLFFGNRGHARSFRIEIFHLSPASQVLPAAQPPPRANQIRRPTFRTLQCRKTEVVPAHRNPQKPSHHRFAARPFQRGL